jgi:hypothetical protein
MTSFSQTVKGLTGLEKAAELSSAIQNHSATKKTLEEAIKRTLVVGCDITFKQLDNEGKDGFGRIHAVVSHHGEVLVVPSNGVYHDSKAIPVKVEDITAVL